MRKESFIVIESDGISFYGFDNNEYRSREPEYSECEFSYDDLKFEIKVMKSHMNSKKKKSFRKSK